MIDETALLKHAAAEIELRPPHLGKAAQLVRFYPLTGTYDLKPYDRESWAIIDFQNGVHHSTFPTKMEPNPYRVIGIVRDGVILAQLKRDGDNAHNGVRRTFEFVGRSDQMDKALCSVEFGLSYPDGSASVEMAMRWYSIGSDCVPRLECFDDAFSSLASFSDLIEALRSWDDQNISPQEFMALLTEHGFSDQKAEREESSHAR